MLRDVGASSLLCHECVLSVIAQLSNKSSSHPACASAESASSVLSGVMVSLTPVFQPKVPRLTALSEYAEFEDADQMVTELNKILSKPEGFPSIPDTRKECKILRLPADQRDHQYVICPEHECECLVYQADQTKSTIEVLQLDQDPFWEPRVKEFHAWYTKSGSKTQKDASSKHAQSVPANPADRQNPKEEGLRWKDIGEAFRCPSAQCNGGSGTPNWVRIEVEQLVRGKAQLALPFMSIVHGHLQPQKKM